MAVLYGEVQVRRSIVGNYVHATLRVERGNWYQLRHDENGQRSWWMACPSLGGPLTITGQMVECTSPLLAIPEAIRDELSAELIAARLRGDI